MREDPLAGPLPVLAGRPPPGAFPPQAVRRDRLRVGLEGPGGEGGSRSRPRALQRRPAPNSPLSGAVDSVPRCALSARLPPPSPPGAGGGRQGRGPLAPGATVDRSGLSSVRPDCVAPPRAGTGPRAGRKGSAAMSATHPTRLETRTKESNARASQRVSSKPHGAMKVRAGARRLRWDPGKGSRGLAPGAPPARLARPVGEVEPERAR